MLLAYSVESVCVCISVCCIGVLGLKALKQFRLVSDVRVEAEDRYLAIGLRKFLSGLMLIIIYSRWYAVSHCSQQSQHLLRSCKYVIL